LAQIPVQTGAPDPVEVTPEHRRTSSEVFDQLCREVSSPKRADRALHVRVAHYEQSGFLNPRLYGFWILPVLPGVEEPPVMPGLDEMGLDWAKAQMSDWTTDSQLEELLQGPGIGLQSPNESTEEQPSLWACVLNSSVEAQVESTLTSLAMLIARQELVVRTEAGDVKTLPSKAARVDEETTKLIGDEVRINGWLSATRAIRARAEAAGCSLHVEYRNPLLDASGARARMQLTRHVYNSLPGVRLAIDRVVNSLTQGWSIAGPSPEHVLQVARDVLDGFGISSLMAHCVRDAFVCGVGVLSLASVPLKDPWLLKPEEVEEVRNETAIRKLNARRETIRPVVAMKGATQIDSPVGLSLLEPFVVNTANRDLYLRVLLSARIVNSMSRRLPTKVTEWAAETEPFAIRQLNVLATASEVFNPAALRLPDPTADLYTAGLESMAPAVAYLTVGR